MTPTFWTHERVAILKRGRADHWTARKIAELLGCTRNAVLGKASRLDLPYVFRAGGRPATTGTRALAAVRRERRTMRVQSARPASASRPRAQPGSVVDLPVTSDEPPSRQVAFADLKAGECRWMSGSDACCCGHAVAQILARGRRMASPYCGFHSARAYRVPEEQRRPAPARRPRGNFA
ncbi:MAG: hypothetical protein K2Y27_07895 [Xanthobacteraceae bacterium]|nr:hypothetical protein [Xanthobacteraceae bacterium]